MQTSLSLMHEAKTNLRTLINVTEHQYAAGLIDSLFGGNLLSQLLCHTTGY